VRNREVLLEESVINRHGGVLTPGPGTRGPDFGPTRDPLNLCQDDIYLIVTCLMLSLKLFKVSNS